jgi:hypothetical protein
VAHHRSLHCATPDFLFTFVALVYSLRPSLRKGAHGALSSAAWQEIRYALSKDILPTVNFGWLAQGLLALYQGTTLVVP